MNPSRPGQTAPIDNHNQERISLAELALAFLKLGTIAFGGPAAHIAMMQDEFVRRRRWLTEAEFLDRLAMASLIPGPSSTEVAIFIGYTKRGWTGLLVAGCCFIIPAAVIVTAIAAAYVRFGSLPQVAGILYGIKPALIAIILQALWSFGRTAVRTKLLAAIGVIAVVLNAAGISPLAVLVIAGIASAAVFWLKQQKTAGLAVAPLFEQFRLPRGAFIGTLLGVSAATVAVPVSILRLFLSFLKIGSVVFGSGYVLLAFLRTEFVSHLHWLTEKQLIDAVAVGQFTPGPVFTTATFIGYLVAGIPGAGVATLGIFLPGFVFVALSGALLPRLRRSALAVATLDGVVVGSLALMAVVAGQLGRAAIVDWFTVLILITSVGLLLRFRINSAWLICGAGFLGWLLQR
jgi:chromate transporter